MRIPDPKANTTTEAYLAYKAGYLEQSELKPKLYEPYLHFDAWLAYWCGLTDTYPVSGYGKNLISPTPYTSSTNVYSPEAGSKINHTYADYVTYELSDGTLSVTTDRQWGGVMMVSPALETGSYHISITVTTGASNNGRCRLQILDADYKVIENADYSSITENSSRTLSWDITLVAGAKFIGVGVATSTSGGGSFTVSDLQLEAGSSATTYEPYAPVPEMLTDEEALVAYLSNVTNTYPEEIKDPYDVRITGYLRYLVSARFGRPDYPVNNEEFYLSNMKPPVVTNDTPSSSIELDDTAEAPFIDVKAYGDTSQTTYTGSNLFDRANAVEDSILTWVAGIDYANTGSITSDYISATEGDFATNYKCVPFFYDSSKTYLGHLNSDGTTIGTSSASDAGFNTFTIPSGQSIAYMRVVYRASSVGNPSDMTDKNIMLNTGSTATDYEPYVGGIRSPSPDYPQDINVVTGRQIVKVNGYNLFDWEELEEIGGDYANATLEEWGPNGVVITGATSSGGDFAFSRGVFRPCYSAPNSAYRISLPASSTVTISADVTLLENNYKAETRIILDPVGRAGSSISLTLNETTRISQTFTNVAEGEYFPLFNLNSNKLRIENIQVEIGDTAHPYSKEPSSYEINLDGKNLWGGYTQYSRTSSGVDFEVKSDGSLTADGIASATAYSITGQVAQSNGTYITLPAGTYYLSSLETIPVGVSLQIVETSASSTIRDGIGSFTLSETTNICARLRIVSGTNLSDGITIHPQIEIGSTATSYEPYHTPLELCKIGDYQDYIYQDADGDWHLHKEISGKYVFTGNEDWAASSYGVNTWNTTQVLRTKADGSAILCLCDIFYGVSNDRRSTSGDNITYCSATNTLWVRNTTLESKTAVQQATAGHYVYYVLATATDTLITDNNLIDQLNTLKEGGSYTGKTYITVTTTAPNLPALLKVEAGEYH